MPNDPLDKAKEREKRRKDRRFEALLLAAYFLAQKELTAAAEGVIETLSPEGIAPEPAVRAFQEKVIGVLQKAHTSAAWYGAQMASGDLSLEGRQGLVNEVVAGEDPFLDGFAADLRNGRYLSTDGTSLLSTLIKLRVASYANKLQATASAAFLRASPAGLRFHWRLGAPEDHCADCVGIADAGPYTIDSLPTYPGAGFTRCLYNCGCYLEREDGRVGPRLLLQAQKLKNEAPTGTAATEFKAPPKEALSSAGDSLMDIPYTADDFPSPGDYQREVVRNGHALGMLSIYGIPFYVENPPYTFREGIGADGKPWRSMVKTMYGEIAGTEGSDGDGVDAFLGPDYDSQVVFIVNQVDPATGDFDEHKVMMGFLSQVEAEAAYRAEYPADWPGLASIIPVSVDDFKSWLINGDKSVPCPSPLNLIEIAPVLYCPTCEATFVGDFCPTCGMAGEPFILAATGDSKGELRKSPPTGWPTDRRAYADPDNWGWRIDKERYVHAALGYYNGGRGKENHSAEEWAEIGRRIAGAATKTYGKQYRLVDGEVKTENEKAKSDAIDKPMHARIAKVAEGIRHCGDYGSVFWNPGAKMVHWTMGDADGGDDTETSDSIKRKFGAIPGVRHVQVGDEWSPRGEDDWEEVKYDRSKRPRAEADHAMTDAFAGCEEHEIFFAATDEYQVLTDALGPGEIMRVRQLAMVVEPRINKNRRLIRRKAALPAFREIRERMKVGAVLGEYRHPKTVKNADGGDAFVDNFDKKTSRYYEVEDPTDDGLVFVKRAILDTPHGRRVAENIKNNAGGLSTRYLADGPAATVDGQRVQDVQRMKISTWDDLDPHEMPAVPETRHNYQLLTDSMRQELFDSEAEVASTSAFSLSGLAGTRPESNTKAAGGTPGSPKETKMNEDIKAALDEYRLSAVLRKKDVIPANRKAVEAEIDRALRKGTSASDLQSALDEVAKIDETVRLSGLFGGRVEPTAWPANNTSDAGGPGYAPDVKINAQPNGMDQVQDLHTIAPDKKETVEGLRREDGGGAASATDEMFAKNPLLKNMLAREQAAQDREARDKAITDALAVHGPEVLKGLPQEAQDAIQDTVRTYAASADAVPSLLAAQLDLYSKAASRERLIGKGLTTLRGDTVHDPGSPRSEEVVDRAPAYMADVDKLLAAADVVARRIPNNPMDPRDPHTQAIRKYNRSTFIDPILSAMEEIRVRTNNDESFSAALDSYAPKSEQDMLAEWDKMLKAATDVTTVSNFYNQPTVYTTVLIQMYQDLTALQFADGMGPGQSEGGKWRGTGQAYSAIGQQGTTGWVLEVPLVTYAAPGGAGTLALRSFGTYDAGLLVPENTGIPSGATSLTWASFATLPRQIAAAVSRQARASAGLGPLNFDFIGQHLYQIGADKNRRIDKAIYDDMLLTSDEYQYVSVTSETVNNAHNSVYASGGSVTVNLNPTKSASAAVAAGDPFITYGANVIGAVRLMGPQNTSVNANGTNGSSSPYFGDGTGYAPILPPRVSYDLKGGGGAYEQVTTHGYSVSAPGSAVAGYLDQNNQVQTYPQTWGDASAPSAATYAVDTEIGVIAFTSGVTGASGVISTTVTASYAYSTNYDTCIVLHGGNVQSFLPITQADVASETSSAIQLQSYLNILAGQFDFTAAIQGSQPRYSSPNLALGTKNVMALLAQAQIFAPLFAPPGTQLYPEPDLVAERNGLKIGRHNSPWNCGDRRVLVSRRGSTKYGVGIPAQITGPYPSYDSSGNVKAVDTFYLEEYSVVATPVDMDTSGNQYNPPSRSIVLRSAAG